MKNTLPFDRLNRPGGHPANQLVFLSLILAGLLLGLSGMARGAEQTISLEYKPNAKVKRSPVAVPLSKIFFDEFRDQRPQPRQIGENLEDKEKRVVILSSDAQGPGYLIRTGLNKEFKNKGFSLAGSPGQADKIISGTLTKFWTVETNRYNSSTQLKLEVKDKNGGVLFSRQLSGTGKNFGRSLSETNYNESISDSVVMIVESLFSDHDFIKALEKTAVARVEEKRPAAPPPAPPAPAPSAKAPPAPAAPATPAPSTPVAAVPDYLFHKVYAGETMATIAKYYSGNANDWKVLASHNLDKEPFKLSADEVVRIPRSLATVHKEQPDFSTAAGKPAPGKGKKPASVTPPPPPPPVDGPAFGPK